MRGAGALHPSCSYDLSNSVLEHDVPDRRLLCVAFLSMDSDNGVKRLPRLRWLPLNFHIRQLVLPCPTPCLLARAVTNKFNWVIRDRHKFELQHMRTLTLLGKSIVNVREVGLFLLVIFRRLVPF